MLRVVITSGMRFVVFSHKVDTQDGHESHHNSMCRRIKNNWHTNVNLHILKLSGNDFASDNPDETKVSLLGRKSSLTRHSRNNLVHEK